MPPEDPLPNSSFANCLEKELYEILSRYNFRGDRLKLVQSLAMVIGENKTLADVCAHTQIAQTTLSTYVRIGKLFLKVSLPTHR
jgi:hypothetical protein